MVVRQQRRDLAMRQDRRHHLARHLGRQQPVAVLGEDGWHPDRIVNPEANEPAEQQVILHLFHQLSLGADREQDLDQAGPDQPFRRDRRAAEISVKRIKLAIQARQRLVHHLPDLAQRMPRGDASLKIDITEQRPARLVRPAHLCPLRYRPKGESRSSNRAKGRFLQQPVRMCPRTATTRIMKFMLKMFRCRPDCLLSVGCVLCCKTVRRP